MTVRKETFHALQSSYREEGQGALTRSAFNEALDLLSQHLATHFEGMRKIKTLALVNPFD